MKYFFSVLFLFFFISSFAQTSSTSFVAKAKHSNKQVVWYEYEYWLDGSKLSDAKNKNKFNDIIFKKVGNKYYKAQTDGAFNVENWGIKKDYEGGKPEENSRLMQAMIDYFPEGYAVSIYIPSGTYEFSKTLRISARPIHLFGDNGTVWGKSSKLSFPGNSDGLLIARDGTGYQETIVEKLCVISRNRNASGGYGISIWARAKIRDCTVKGFSMNGFNVWGSIEQGSEVSGSVLESCHSLENGQDGFSIGRTDGNAVTIINCDSRDNVRYGFNDDSFLGNNFISCMAHYNAGGDFYVRDKANARSMFLACYSEGGNKLSELGPHSTVVGGIWGTGYTKDGGKTALY